MSSPVRLGVISDTHAATIDEVPAAVRDALAGVDIIIHAGDFTRKAVLDGLREIGEVTAVRGNMDSEELKSLLPEKEVLEINGRKIGLIHGWGAPWGIAERVKGQFADVDVVLFGHSHEAFCRYIQGVLLFNPGRARDSYGLLTIGDDIEAVIVKV
jgi:putative phosphoesterase